MIYTKELLKKAANIQDPISKVLTIGGSPRIGGNTDLFIKQISLGIEQEAIEVENVSLGKIEFKGCVGCEKCRKDKVCTNFNDGMTLLYPDIIESKGLVLVSPVYNYNITSLMKAFIDRLYCFYNFDNNTRPREWSSRLANQNRKVVIAAICEQSKREDMGFAIEAMQKPMEALGFEIVETMAVFKAFEKGAVKKDTDILDQAYQMGAKLGRALK
jgi:multimeric flavodoxin WrbA